MKKNLLMRAGSALLAAMVAISALGGTALADSNCSGTLSGYQPNRFVIDQGGCAHNNGSDAYDGADKVATTARATYDFTVQGGAAGTANIGVVGGGVGAITLPANAVILDGVLDIVTSFTQTGSPTFALTSESSKDIMDAMSTSTLSAGRHAISPSSVATSVKTTAARTLTYTIGGTGAVTAGKAVLFLRYYVSG